MLIVLCSKIKVFFYKSFTLRAGMMDELLYWWAAGPMCAGWRVSLVWSTAESGSAQLPPSLHHTTINTPTLCITTWGHGHNIGAVLHIIFILKLIVSEISYIL